MSFVLFHRFYSFNNSLSSYACDRNSDNVILFLFIYDVHSCNHSVFERRRRGKFGNFDASCILVYNVFLIGRWSRRKCCEIE